MVTWVVRLWGNPEKLLLRMRTCAVKLQRWRTWAWSSIWIRFEEWLKFLLFSLWSSYYKRIKCWYTQSFILGGKRTNVKGWGHFSGKVKQLISVTRDQSIAGLFGLKFDCLNLNIPNKVYENNVIKCGKMSTLNSECGRFLYSLLISQGLIYLYRFHNYSAQDWLFEEQRSENNESKQYF